MPSAVDVEVPKVPPCQQTELELVTVLSALANRPITYTFKCPQANGSRRTTATNMATYEDGRGPSGGVLGCPGSDSLANKAGTAVLPVELHVRLRCHVLANIRILSPPRISGQRTRRTKQRYAPQRSIQRRCAILACRTRCAARKAVQQQASQRARGLSANPCRPGWPPLRAAQQRITSFAPSHPASRSRAVNVGASPH